MSRVKPTLLLILDGWGSAPPGPGNAVSLAETPNLDRILAAYPKTLLKCSGRAVGLPDGFMGNSEVGHMNIGAGRVVYQDMTRIDMAIEDKSLFSNPVLIELMDKTKLSGGRLHLMGLISDGGVHSHVRHVRALLEMAKERGVEVFVHAFLDGRDTPPTSGIGYVRELAEFLAQTGAGEISTIIGRYWAMDRDKRWERNHLAYEAMVLGRGVGYSDPEAAIQAAYEAGEKDEFVKPRVRCDESGQPLGLIRDRDGVFFFNFRADRARQIVQSLFDPDFNHFERVERPKLSMLATMTEYESTFGLPTAFAPVEIKGTIGQVLSEMGLKQLRIAETEKYAHVTYFLNCGREEPFPGEERILVPSPREVATYDLKPQMSCPQVTEDLIRELKSGQYSLAVCNLANLDMVGHTGVIEAAIKACQAVDSCVGRIIETVLQLGGRALLTADHGNAEEMIDSNGGVQTAHSHNMVPFVFIENNDQDEPRPVQLRQGVLGDIAPTILAAWEVDKPKEMTGQNLVLTGREQEGGQ